VTPVQSSARDAQTGSGAFGRDPSAAARPGEPPRARASEAETAQPAPLLPRPQPEQGQRQGAEKPGTQEADKAEAEREQQALQAQEQASKQRFQDVISNVWKASAAVVDMALGREAANASRLEAVPGAVALGAAPAQPLTAPAAVAAPAAPVSPVAAPLAATASDEADLEALKAQQDVLAYDAQGHSSLAPLEAGTLVSRRV
jgi:hypothetical protein